MNSTAISTEERSLAGFNQAIGVLFNLTVELRIVDRVFSAQNGVPLAAEVGKFCRELDGRKPVATLDHHHQLGKFRYHVATNGLTTSNCKK